MQCLALHASDRVFAGRTALRTTIIQDYVVIPVHTININTLPWRAVSDVVSAAWLISISLFHFFFVGLCTNARVSMMFLTTLRGGTELYH